MSHGRFEWTVIDGSSLERLIVGNAAQCCHFTGLIVGPRFACCCTVVAR